jgi:hypothetical protein
MLLAFVHLHAGDGMTPEEALSDALAHCQTIRMKRQNEMQKLSSVCPQGGFPGFLFL